MTAPSRPPPRDFFGWICERLLGNGAVAPSLSDAIVITEMEARIEWGGKRPYIAKTPRQIERRDAISEPDVLP